MRKPRVFDAHFHIIDPRFPLIPNQGYLPEPFLVSDYLMWAEKLGIQGGAVVSGSFQAFDQEYLVSALKGLGPNFVGVTQLPHTISDEEILRLHDAGVRALRFNLKRGGAEELIHLESLGKRVYEIAKWHTELYIDSKQLKELTPVLLKLPDVSIDHLGLSKEGFPVLLQLVERGVKVKATGFGRIDFSVVDALKAISAIREDALLFGTDLPSTRAKRPFEEEDITLIYDALGDQLAEKVLFKNGANFYHIGNQ